MATDATGTPTALGIPTFNTAVDAPSGAGSNAQMASIDTLLQLGVTKPSGIATGEVPVWNGSAFVRSSVTKLTQNGIAFDTWQAYTPAWTGTSVNPTLGNGAISGRYAQMGKTVHVMFSLTFGSTSAEGTGTFLFSLPVAASGSIASLTAIGSVFVQDSSGPTYYAGIMYLNTATTAVGIGGSSFFGSGYPAVWAVNDTLRGSMTYEAA